MSSEKIMIRVKKGEDIHRDIQKNISFLKESISDLENELEFKREMIRDLALFMNGEGECICGKKKNMDGCIKMINPMLSEELLLPDEDGEYHNYLKNIMCVPCLVDRYMDRNIEESIREKTSSDSEDAMSICE